MTKQTIRVGDSANDKKGDSLRAAFIKVNENFTDLYTLLGLGDGTLNIGAFEFAGSTITTTDSSAITIDQATTVTSNLTVGGDILPSTNFGGNLGSPTQQWKSLYVSTNTIYINNVPLSLDSSNNLLVNNAPISTAINYTSIPNAPTDISDLDDIDGLLNGSTSVDTTETRTDTENWESAYYQGGEGTYYITFTNIAPNMRRWYQLYMDNSKSTGRSITLNDNISVTYNSFEYNGNGTFYLYLDEAPNPNPTTITSVAAECVMENKVAVSETGQIDIYSGAGEAVNIQSGFRGAVTVRAGDDISLLAGNKVTSDDNGGTIQITAGDGGSADNNDGAGAGGAVQIYAGDGGGSSNSWGASSGGSITIQSGQGGGANSANNKFAGQGAHLTIRAGDAGSNDGNVGLGSVGGNVDIYAGSSSSADAGGGIVLQAAGGATVGGSVNISAGEGGTTDGSVEINTVGGDYTWTFDPTGATRFPNNTIKTLADDRLYIDVYDDQESYAEIILRNWDLNEDQVTAQLTVGRGDVVITAGTTKNWTFNGDGNLVLPASGDIFASDGVTSVLGGSVDRLTNGSYEVILGSDGITTLPAGGAISIDNADGSIGPVGDNLEITWDNEDLVLRSLAGNIEIEADNDFAIRVNYSGVAEDYLSKWSFADNDELVNITGDSAIITEAGDLTLQGGRNTLSSGNVNIVAVNNGVAVKTWEFNNDGITTFPDNKIKTVEDNTFTIETNGISPIGGAIVFDRVDNGYLTPDTAINFGTGAWTIEAWIYPEDTGPHYIVGVGSTPGVSIYIENSTTLIVQAEYGSAVSWTIGYNVNQWNHFAISFDSTDIAVWVNGVRSSSGAQNYARDWGNNVLTVGAIPWKTNYGNLMKMTQLRVVTGSAVYDPTATTITVPTSRLTNIAGTQLLLNAVSSGTAYTDSSNNDMSITDTDTAWASISPQNELLPHNWTFGTDGTLSVNSNSSLVFETSQQTRGSAKVSNADLSYISVAADASLALGTNNFTIEWWQYQTQRGPFDGAFGYYNADHSFYFPIGTSQYLLYVSGTDTFTINVETSNLPSLNAWHHFAVVRDGTTFTLYVDGTSVGTATSTVDLGTPADPITVGSSGGDDGSTMTGYITNFRIVNGTAVYTSNFTPSTTPLTAIANTELLLLADSSTALVTDTSGSQTVTNINSVDWNSESPFAPVITPTTWYFGADGTITLPGLASITDSGGDTFIKSVAIGSSNKAGISAYEDNRAYAWIGGVNIETDRLGTTKEWSFGTHSEFKIPGGVHEKFQTKADATGTVTHDCESGYIFYHTSPDANWTANFTNLEMNVSYATTVSLIITQGGTGYYPNAVQIGGAAQTINWQGNTTPTPSVNRKDVVTFSILRTDANTYVVLGQLTGF